ncbi:unnamed protein product [Rotaria sp. Silwood1]|nr:unnamed protein product [Rotaria sp. Silwood1]CAF1307088.1 unnamed protein product [Rotaria sp. Silwood1]
MLKALELVLINANVNSNAPPLVLLLRKNSFDHQVSFRSLQVRNFKILIYGLPDLRNDQLQTAIIHCQSANQLRTALNNYHESLIVIVCNSNRLTEIDTLLMNYEIDTLYVCNNDEDQDIREWFDGLIFENMIEINNRRQLMRHLYTKTMLCYYNQGLEHQKNGDFGLANLCFLDAQTALQYSANFM